MLRVIALFAGLVTLVSGPALSETYFVAPLGTTSTTTPDGTEGLPFLSIPAALASGKVKGGDTLLLKDGAYGAVDIKANASFDTPVTITSQNAKAAQFDSILLAGTTRNLVLRNLSVWPRTPTAEAAANGAAYLVRSYSTTSGITLDGLDIRSEAGAEAYMQWDAAHWEARKYSGIFLQGPRGLVTRSRLTGIYHGIMVMSDSQIIDNVVDGFNGDGMRAFSRSIVRGNRVMNCVKTDDNHDDGFQSFSSNGVPVSDLVIDGNIILEWTGDPSNPQRGLLQGIGLFDGFYDNLTIQNNLVSVSSGSYHGVSVYGARGAKIVNNTVVDALGQTGIYPWLRVNPHKDGTPSRDVLLANNVAMSFQGTASAENNVVFLDNSVVGTPSTVFENPAALDYRPKATSGFVDTADAIAAPALDIQGQPRPGGVLPDRGAYELQTSSTTTTTTGDTTTTTTGDTTTTTTTGGGPKRVKPPPKK